MPRARLPKLRSLLHGSVSLRQMRRFQMQGLSVYPRCRYFRGASVLRLLRGLRILFFLREARQIFGKLPGREETIWTSSCQEKLTKGGECHVEQAGPGRACKDTGVLLNGKSALKGEDDLYALLSWGMRLVRCRVRS